jgi:hypothetical protein
VLLLAVLVISGLALLFSKNEKLEEPTSYKEPPVLPILPDQRRDRRSRAELDSASSALSNSPSFALVTNVGHLEVGFWSAARELSFESLTSIESGSLATSTQPTSQSEALR